MAKRIEISRQPAPTAATLTATAADVGAAHVKVVNRKAGPVTLLDKFKGYYHTAIAVLGGILIFVNETTSALNFLPGNDKHYVDIGIAILTAIATLLKNNEQWVDDL